MMLEEHARMAAEAYPKLNVGQLGMFVMYLGMLRASMGHEGARGTLESYIHPEHLSEGQRECYEFLAREILAMNKSRVDIDYWKKGNQGSFREDTVAQEV